MSVQTIQDPGQVSEAIQSGKPTIIHYWDPNIGLESPIAPILHDQAENRLDLDFYIVNSGFIAPPHSEDDLPLTVFYIGGNAVDQAPFDPSEVQNLFQRI
ncbi:hypothetical protein F9C07_11291 [Aspergillus flavus]|uniref:Uncharacterized protein n=1 Tax=Aspergillus flavus (strain ATCC 200026 / FGSC A1120 / IAM 13836 / NRRL 3357 / JCM 12722 / SRRC 167) TaxID=332952 RepID=A0A7G5JMQ5_ASPFN|nr:uncharacterized protein G4B84_000143 [Aspergillus flavus NRRL3357]KAF7630575.1 hypothetical protein AFLA_011197 [Aspergillus flavus NRRL3357]QMW24898.1 hypothetical protein G4B84_000143 [Aspergillus flavus NRRL3357]QMW36897.1 hypothetical protein G4B11_000133 [Aspergillus flavus]QRD89197.1 hypothetical protein F9C07_11291 [Aspergillus flavus]